MATMKKKKKAKAPKKTGGGGTPPPVQQPLPPAATPPPVSPTPTTTGTTVPQLLVQQSQLDSQTPPEAVDNTAAQMPDATAVYSTGPADVPAYHFDRSPTYAEQYAATQGGNGVPDTQEATG